MNTIISKSLSYTHAAALAFLCLTAANFNNSAYADAPLVWCDGSACGGHASTAFAYRIDSVSYPMMEFRVGTNDLNINHYLNISTPPGWNFTIDKQQMYHDHEVVTPHGQMPTGPCRCLTAGSAYWWTDDPNYAIESFTFGYDHSWQPEDTAWYLLTRREGPPPQYFEFSEFWDAPHGTGAGPVHGPSIMPGSIINFGTEEIIQAAGTDIQVPGYSVPSYTYWDGDLLQDLIISEGGGGFDGKVRIYLNVGSVSDPQFNNFFYAQSNGTDLTIPSSGCLGACPRVVYWDADTRKDLVIGRSDGYIMLYTNINTDEDPAFDTGTYLQVGSAGQKVNINVGSRATPTITDWNNDGKKDLIIGAMDGKIHIFINEGTDTAPDFITEIFAQSYNSDLQIDSSRSCPAVYDLDNDGKKDILAGNTNGELLFYSNHNTDDSPAFAGYSYTMAGGDMIDLGSYPRSRQSLCDWTEDHLIDVIVGCDDGKVHLYQGLPTPAYNLNIYPDPLRAGQPAIFTATGSGAGKKNFLAYSLIGLGTKNVPPLHVTLNLNNPVQAGSMEIADSDGNVDWILNIPKAGANRTVWLQAAQMNRKTNVYVILIR